MTGLRLPILYLLLILAPQAHAGFFFWNRGNCPKALTQELYDQGQGENFESLKVFRRWINRLPKYHGLSVDLLKTRYQKLNAQSELISLMKGMVVPSGRENVSLKLSGGWGQDFMFVPTFQLWESVNENFAPLVDRMGEKLHLDPILVQQLFRGDHISIPDSAWAIAESGEGSEVKRGSVKITYFDREMTSDGPWPRFSFESVFAPDSFTMYQVPNTISGFYADLALEGFFSLKSSLGHWGLLPLEAHTDKLVPEHDPKTYDPQYAELFSDPFLLRHQMFMTIVIEGFRKRDVKKRMEYLLDFRERNIPKEALEVAELQRFNIPPGLPPATKTQLFYATVVLLRQRPIKTVYLLAPKPFDPNKPHDPRFQLFSVPPGWGWIKEAAKKANENLYPEVPYEPEEAQNDPLREMYEKLGFEVLETLPYAFGLPNGGHIMRAPARRVIDRLVKFQWKHKQYLSESQKQVVQSIMSELESEPPE